MLHTRTLAALALAGSLVLTACGDDADNDDANSVNPAASETPGETTDAPTDAPTDTPTTGAGETAAGDDVVASAVAAIAAAEQEAGGTAFELSSEDGGWEVDVAVGDRYVEVRIGADGTVQGTDDEDDLDGGDRAGLDAASITLADAVQTAAAEGEGRLDGADLDDDGGTHAWEVQFENGNEYDVYVDVATGEVLRVTTDD